MFRYIVFFLMCIGVFYFQASDTWNQGAVIALIGFFAVGLSMRHDFHKSTWRPIVNPPMVISNLSILFIVIGFVCLIIVGEFSGNILNRPYETSVTHHNQFVLLVIGIIFLLLGFSNVRYIPLATYSLSQSAIILIAISLFAFILRVWRLETAVHYFIDEIHFAKSAQGISRTDFVPLTAPFGNVSRPQRVVAD